MAATLLSAKSTILPNTAASLSLLAIATGATALLYPRTAIEMFGFQPVNNREEMGLSEAIIRTYGIRNFSMGLTNTIVWIMMQQSSFGATRLIWKKFMGLLFIANAATPLIDGYVCLKQGKTNPWNHWVFTPITILLGTSLLMTGFTF